MNGYDALLFDLYKNALNRRHDRDIYESQNQDLEKLALGDAVRELNVFMEHKNKVEKSIENHEKVFIKNA